VCSIRQRINISLIKSVSNRLSLCGFIEWKNKKICGDHNFHKSEVALLKSWIVPRGGGDWVHRRWHPPAMSPSKTFLRITIRTYDNHECYTPPCLKEPHIFQELHTNLLVTEQEREEQVVSITILPQHHLPIWHRQDEGRRQWAAAGTLHSHY
jgi:hypothetical protein